MMGHSRRPLPASRRLSLPKASSLSGLSVPRVAVTVAAAAIYTLICGPTLLRERPELCIEELVDLYVDRLPEESFEGSCVFHGPTGCTLSRDMRSDTCNLHFCAGQHSLQAALAQGAPPRAFVAISDGSEIVASRFLSRGTCPEPDSAGS
jgi:hypothetical protein